MAQKDKVKELVGRGLDSYHTKALQQMDRIEKKNKEQNHKISILSNELDNDYLTKTEEGSVVSLEHSKEGMVYLDELQGNTLVNYCTDGSKEMTLNGDIDVEGTFVTTTEGVDNGKVDVMCEGNTLVNLVKTLGEKTFISRNFELLHSKVNTVYTVLLDIKLTSEVYVGFLNSNGSWSGSAKTLTTSGSYILNFTPIDEDVKFRINGASTQVTVDKLIVLEGNYTNISVPQVHFEGMKSVGQDDENGHKIEILSRNKNHVLSKPMTVVQDIVSHDIYLEPNKEYSISSNVPYNGGLCMISKNHSNTNPIFTFQNWGETVNKFTTPNNLEKGIYSLVFWKSQLSADDNSWTQVELGKTITNYIPYNSNKKEILMNEPLRGLPIGVKDKFIKIGSKFFIERNIRQKLLTGADSENWLIHSDSDENVIEFRCNTGSPFITNNSGSTISDKFIGKSGGNVDRIAWADDTVYITISRNKLATVDVAGLRQWLSNNNVLVQNQLATPIYEPLEVEPTLLTYNDVTHISNNSIIPCTMKIKNTGYNAIIKPSTLYTIALDTNKSGTIGMNLGGVKGTTTNNVLKLTTPETLTDDSLRLYGKGIKGSKIRLLEGDKTNWIPSHFEGMKSSFEDKLQDDGSYKMEILSNNKNLLNLTDIVHKGIGAGCKLDACSTELIQYTSNQEEWTQIFFMMKLKPFTRYTLSAELQSMNVYVFNDRVGTWDTGKYIGAMQNTTNTLQKKQFSFTTNKTGCISIRFTNERMLGVNIAKNIILSEVVGDYIPKKSNKIQFSSIEPLREVHGTKDKLVFVDNKLMIERNCGTLTLDSSQDFVRANKYDNGNLYGFEKDFSNIKPTSQWNKAIKCDKYVYYAYISDAGMRDLKGEWVGTWSDNTSRFVIMLRLKTKENTLSSLNEYLNENPISVTYIKKEPTYEEIPFELQKLILEGYENGTLFFDTNIPPTSTVTYAGETPIVKSVKLNKTEVLSNTEDINDNIIPYLMDMDYRVVMLQLATEELEGGVSMARLFGGTYEMIKRDILSKRLTREEYGHRLADYFNAGKLTEEQVRELEELR